MMRSDADFLADVAGGGINSRRAESLSGEAGSLRFG